MNYYRVTFEYMAETGNLLRGNRVQKAATIEEAERLALAYLADKYECSRLINVDNFHA